MKIAENIKYYRKGMGLTQKQLAQFLDSTKSTVSNYETGFSCPDIETLIKLADVFKITLDDLVGREFN